MAARERLFELTLAGFGLAFESDRPGIISVLKRRYGRFRSSGAAACRFRAEEKGGRASPFTPSVRTDGRTLLIKRGDFRAELDLESGGGELRAAANAQCLDAFLRSLTSALLLRAGGLMLHSACFVLRGKAWLFPGKSGAGKSTLSRLAAAGGAELVSDEINLLRPEKGGFGVHGSPFWGEMRADGRPGRWPLGGIWLPVKAGAHAAEPCGAAEVMRTLLRCLVNFERTPAAAGLALSNAAALLAGARCGRLRFSKKDGGFLGLMR